MGNKSSSTTEHQKAKNQKNEPKASFNSKGELDKQTRANSIQDSFLNQMSQEEKSEYYANEALINDIDNRKMVPNNKMHPYWGIGKICVEMKNIQTGKICINEATGFLIAIDHIMTALHTFKIEGYELGKIYFYPEPLSASEPLKNPIQAHILIQDERYGSLNKLQRKLYDYAVLKLAPNTIIRKEHVLKCNFNYDFQKHKQSLINIPGYPSQDERNQLLSSKDYKNDYLLFYDQRPAVSSVDYRLRYLHSTTKRTSGAPLLIKTSDSYQVVGIHLWEQYQMNAGILLSELNLKQQILTLISLAHSSQSASPEVSLEIQQLISKFSKKNQIKNINNEQLAALAVNGHKFPQLQTIYLSGNKITDAGLEALAVNGHKFPQLQTINLNNNKITGAGLEALAVNGHKFPQLQTIYLDSNEITDAGLEALAVNGHKFPQLQTIDLGYNQITGAGLEALAVNGHKFPQLQRIYLYGNKITDAGLEALAVNGHKFPQLQTINLNNNKITGAGLEALAVNGHKFPQLQEIYLGYNKISKKSLGSKLHQIVKLKDLKVSKIEVYC